MDNEAREALRNLVKKLKEIEDNDSFKSIISLAWIHGHEYTGPNWKEELEAAEKILSKMKMDLFEIVSNRPTVEKPKDLPRCPHCAKCNLELTQQIHTLIGVDFYNHHWDCYFCCNCKKEFTREYKEDNVWYTDKEKVVLKGVPSCFEKYVYKCAKCEGVVERTYTELDGETTAKILTYDPKGKQFRVFYRCVSCGHGGEVEEEYWRCDI